MKQTAVQFIHNELRKLNIMTNSSGTSVSVIRIFEQAIEMEKEQICDAFYYGVDVDSFCVNNPYKVAENYYKETYEAQETN